MSERGRLNRVLMPLLFFVLAGLAEIGGGYLVWLYLREGKPLWYGLLGGVDLRRSVTAVGLAG